MNRTRSDDEGLAIGFISLADLFFVGLVACFAYAKYSDDLLVKRDDERDTQQAVLSRVAKDVATTRDGYRTAAIESSLNVTLTPLRHSKEGLSESDIPEAGILPAESEIVINEFQGKLESMRSTVQTQHDALTLLRSERDRARAYAREHYSESVSFLQKLDWEMKRSAGAQSENESLSATLLQQTLDYEKAQKEISRLKAELAASRSQGTRLRDAARAHYSDVLSMTEKIDGLLIQLSLLQMEGTVSREEIARLKESLRKRVMLPKELLGVRGDLKKVAFVVDCSTSMQSPAPSANSPEPTNSLSWWKVVTGTVHLWIETLPMESAVIVYYSDSVTVFPESKNFMMLETDRGQLVKSVLEREAPNGNTNTLLALMTAYEELDGCDTIILFTDGEPTVSPLGKLNERLSRKPPESCWKEIFDYVEQRKARGQNIPVNVVALGNYFNSMYGPNLVDLASRTGGSFLGRGGGKVKSSAKEQ